MRERAILEVETPILSHSGVSDPYIQSMQTQSRENIPLYLHTSPEFCMKRLLAADSGSIYQIARVFRDEEVGKRHTTEFSMLEWYHLDFDYHQLMAEVGDLLNVIGLAFPEKITYSDAFLQTIQVDPHIADNEKLRQIARNSGWETESDDRHELLDFVFSSVVLRQLNTEKPLIIHDYPACMAVLSTLKPTNPPISERFELFINGMEIANGFNELTDASEQHARFEQDLEKRRATGKETAPIDEYFLAALDEGLPKCAGVAIGLDRLLMVLTKREHIHEVNAFTLDNN